MNTSNMIDELAKALATFQAKMPTLPKNASGYGYKYTPLDVVVDAMRDHMAECGLSYVQMPSTPPVEYGPAVALTTRLMHTSGQWVEDSLVIPIPKVGKANEAQAYGAALTYARRYALTAMLGIVADEDVDAATMPQKPKAPATNGNGRANVTADQLKALHAAGRAVYGPIWDSKRGELVDYVTEGRTKSSKELYADEAAKIIKGINAKANGATA